MSSTVTNNSTVSGVGGGTWGTVGGTITSQTDLQVEVGLSDVWGSYPSLSNATPSVGTPTVTILETDITAGFYANAVSSPVQGEDWGFHQARLVSLPDGRVAMCLMNTRLIKNGGTDPVDRVQVVVRERAATGSFPTNWTTQIGSSSTSDTLLAADNCEDIHMVADQYGNYHMVTAFGRHSDSVNFGSYSFPASGTGPVKSLATGMDTNDSGASLWRPSSSRYFGTGISPSGTVLTYMSVDDPSGQNTVSASTRIVSATYAAGTGLVYGTPQETKLGMRCGYPFVFPGALGPNSSYVMCLQPNPWWSEMRPYLGVDPGGDTYLFHGGQAHLYGDLLVPGGPRKVQSIALGLMKDTYSSSDIFKRQRHVIYDSANARFITVLFQYQMQDAADGWYIYVTGLDGKLLAPPTSVGQGWSSGGSGMEIIQTGDGRFWLFFDYGVGNDLVDTARRFYVVPLTEPKQKNVFVVGTPVNIGSQLPSYAVISSLGFRTAHYSNSGSAKRSNYVDTLIYHTKLTLPVANHNSPYPYQTNANGTNELVVSFARIQLY